MSRARNNLIRRYKRALNKAADMLNVEITVYYTTGEKITCSSCTWDPVNKESTDPNCVECNGNFYYDEILSKNIDAMVSRVGVSLQFIPLQLMGGQIDHNDVFIASKLTDVLIDPADVSGSTIFEQCKYILLNGDRVIKKTTPLKYGPAGYLYRCAFIGTIDN